jgi:uncharacterized protein YodC (DUF2158 family)
MIERKRFSVKDLIIVNNAEDFRDSREPPLRIGDVVRLNSGSPRWLIVDMDAAGNVTVAWRDEEGEVQEHVLPEPCVHRVSPLD